MSLKRYLFLLVALFVVLMAAIQLSFIYYVQQQVSAEVEEKSRALSKQAIELLLESTLPDLKQQTPVKSSNELSIRIKSTPNKMIELGDGYQFITGEQTKTISISSAHEPSNVIIKDELRGGLQQLSISRLKNNYEFSVDVDNNRHFHRQIIQFDKKDSAVQRYFNWLILATLVASVVGLFLAYLLARHISIPLAHLSKGFKQLEDGDLGSLVVVGGIKEVRDTLLRFNHMSIRLAELNDLERQFAQQQQMAELGEVARGLAHTLRNPINTIGLAIEQMSQQQMTDQQRSELAIQARQKIVHIDNTIKSLLTLTTAGVDRAQIVDINQVIEDIIMELSMVGSNQIKFSASQRCELQGAESEIRSMIHTLLVNAIEASPDSEPVSVFIDTNNNKIAVTIIDQGTGIEESIQKELFKPHVSTKPEGAGMGLYIAQRICRLHYQGDLTLKSNIPQGCIAELTLSQQTKRVESELVKSDQLENNHD
jgi:signal transduction histidine kinase